MRGSEDESDANMCDQPALRERRNGAQTMEREAQETERRRTEGNLAPHSSTIPFPANAHTLPSVRPWVISLIPFFVVLVVSAQYAWQKTRNARNDGASSEPNHVVKHLDAFALHHVVLPVSNLTRSLKFYAYVLGGQELDLDTVSSLSSLQEGARLSADVATFSAPKRCRMVNFGVSQVLLMEQEFTEGHVAQHYAQSLHIAFRLGRSSDTGEFLQAVDRRLRDHPDLAEVSCQIAKWGNESDVAGAPHWQVVGCSGPDREVVQFWQPSLKAAEVLNKARRSWSRSASDPRGRDLFE